MMTPSIFGRDLFDDFFDYPFSSRRNTASEVMKTDIRDTGQEYEITMNLPGVCKDDVKAELKDGYLTVQAASGQNHDKKDSEGRYIRRERYYGSCSRCFYVGEAVTQEDVRAKFENGVLKLTVPKKEAQPAVEEKKYISIEG